MAKLIGSPAKVTIDVQLSLTETELRALEALTGYGTDTFLKHFYEHLGTAYLQQHEAGIRSLFETIRQEAPVILARANAARKVISDAEKEAAKRRY